MKKALLLIEFQNEWLLPECALHHLMEDKAQFESSIQKAKEALAFARQQNMLVIHSGLAFTENYEELGKAQHGLRAHIPKFKTFQAGSKGAEFYSDFNPLENELIVQGRLGASAFSGSNLDAILKNNRIEELYIMGYALHVCVESTFRAASDLGYEAKVIVDACSAFSLAQKKYFITSIAPHFGELLTVNNFKENNNE